MALPMKTRSLQKLDYMGRGDKLISYMKTNK